MKKYGNPQVAEGDTTYIYIIITPTHFQQLEMLFIWHLNVCCTQKQSNLLYMFP